VSKPFSSSKRFPAFDIFPSVVACGLLAKANSFGVTLSDVGFFTIVDFKTSFAKSAHDYPKILVHASNPEVSEIL